MRIIPAVLCIGSLLFLCGCGGGSSTSTTSNSGSSGSGITVLGVETPSSVSVVTAQE